MVRKMSGYPTNRDLPDGFRVLFKKQSRPRATENYGYYSYLPRLSDLSEDAFNPA